MWCSHGWQRTPCCFTCQHQPALAFKIVLLFGAPAGSSGDPLGCGSGPHVSRVQGKRCSRCAGPQPARILSRLIHGPPPRSRWYPQEVDEKRGAGSGHTRAEAQSQVLPPSRHQGSRTFRAHTELVPSQELLGIDACWAPMGTLSPGRGHTGEEFSQTPKEVRPTGAQRGHRNAALTRPGCAGGPSPHMARHQHTPHWRPSAQPSQ